jgi:hypothetical protein
MEEENERFVDMLVFLSQIEEEQPERRRHRPELLQAFWDGIRRAPQVELRPYYFNKRAVDDLKIPLSTVKRLVKSKKVHYPTMAK